MQTLSHSPELCSKIIHFVCSPPHSSHTHTSSQYPTTHLQPHAHAIPALLSLSLTCKSFQREAEPLLYSHVVLSDPVRFLSFARAVLGSGTASGSGNGERLKGYVRVFVFNQEYYRRQSQQRRGGRLMDDEEEDEEGTINLGRDFWAVVQLVLAAISPNLEVLMLSDTSASNTFIFDPPNLPSTTSSSPAPTSSSLPFYSFPNLRELKLRFAWDAPVVRFISRLGPSLRILNFFDSNDLVDWESASAPGLDSEPSHHADHAVAHLEPSHVPPNLTLFDGSLSVGIQLLPAYPSSPRSSSASASSSSSNSKLTHIQLVIDTDPLLALSLLASRFSSGAGSGALKKTLRSLSLLDVPDEITVPLMGMIARSLPGLRHVGLLPYPINGRHEFLHHLTPLPHLTSLELDLSRWSPSPSHPGAQRALAAELHTFCPSLGVVVFWIGNHRVRWVWSLASLGLGGAGVGGGDTLKEDVSAVYGGPMGVWTSRVDAHQYPQFSTTWCYA